MYDSSMLIGCTMLEDLLSIDIHFWLKLPKGPPLREGQELPALYACTGQSPMSAFEELGICPDIIQAIEEDEWLLPTAVQQEAVPLILTGQDVLVASETGSGKTGAFGLPCLQIVHENLRGKCQTKDATGST